MSVQWCDVSADDWESAPDNPPRMDSQPRVDDEVLIQQVGDALVLSQDGELVVAVHDVADRDVSDRKDYQDRIDRQRASEQDSSAGTADT